MPTGQGPLVRLALKGRRSIRRRGRGAGRPRAAWAVRRRLTALQRSAVAELLRISPVADELGHRFAAAGHEMHLVGGSVRDALLSRLGEDLDFTTDARPARCAAGW